MYLLDHPPAAVADVGGVDEAQRLQVVRARRRRARTAATDELRGKQGEKGTQWSWSGNALEMHV